MIKLLAYQPLICPDGLFLLGLVIALREARTIPHRLSFELEIPEKQKEVIDTDLLSFVRCGARTHPVLYLLALEASSYSRSLTDVSRKVWLLEKKVRPLAFLSYSLPYKYLHLLFRTSRFPYDSAPPVGLNYGRLWGFLKKKHGNFRRRVISKSMAFSVSKLPLRTVISCWRTLQRFKNPGQQSSITSFQ